MTAKFLSLLLLLSSLCACAVAEVTPVSDPCNVINGQLAFFDCSQRSVAKFAPPDVRNVDLGLVCTT